MECRRYESKHYAQERCAEGMTVDNMCKRGCRGYSNGHTVAVQEKCGGYGNGHMCSRGMWRVLQLPVSAEKCGGYELARIG